MPLNTEPAIAKVFGEAAASVRMSAHSAKGTNFTAGNTAVAGWEAVCEVD